MVKEMKTFQRLTLTAMLAASALLVTGCGGNNNSQEAPTPAAAAESATPAATAAPATAAPTATAVPAVALPAGIVAKGVASDGKGTYLQTTIADSDPAMKYNPSITDAAAKAHFSEEDLAEAQKVIVKFIAEESIDSTLNGGGNDIDGWFAAHKDQIYPTNQPIMLADLKAGKDDVAREQWIANKPGYSYMHGDTTPRIKSRTITPTNFHYVEGNGLQGVWLDTKASWTMEVTGGSHTGVQSTTAEIGYAAAKDVDGKWKIAGYDTNYHTAEG